MANKRSDFQYIKWILDEAFLCKEPDHLTMREEKGDEHKPQVVTIKPQIKAITEVALYRFDCEDNGDFLPFFNDRDGAPESLNAFCDYIALVEHKDRLFIFLMELKRGKVAGAEDQLEGSYEFMQYLLRTAERIKDANGMPDFDKRDVAFRRIIVCKTASNKRITKNKDLQDIDKENVIRYDCDTTLTLPAFI